MTTYGQAEAIMGSYRNTVTSVNREVQNFTARVNALKSPNIRVTVQQTSQLLKDIRTAIPASTEKLLAINKVAQTTVNDLPNGEQKNKLQNQLTVLDTAGATSVSQLNDLAVETTKIEKSLVDNSRPPISPPVPAPAPQRAQNKVSDDATVQKENKPVEGNPNDKNKSQEDIRNPQQARRPNLKNPLSQFSSYTYTLSLYALTADDVNDFYRLGKWDTSKLELILQSGGVNASGKNADAPRSKWFNYDFYMDNLEIVSLINSKETGAATTSYQFRFQIFEPYAMTFTSRLVFMQREIQQRASIRKNIVQQVDALNCPVLLVIKFQGYDAKGNLISELNSPGLVQYTQTDTPGAFERAFPIYFSKFSFKLENKVTVYDVEAKIIDQQIAFGAKRGVIDVPISISADTVEAAIGGTKNQTDGLINKLNNYMKTLVGTTDDNKKIGVADEYSVVFNDSSIANATIVDKDYWTKIKTPVAPVANTAQVNAKKSNENVTAQRGKRTIDIAPGTPILSAIDQIITQSSYVSDALTASQKETPPPLKDERDAESNPKPKEVAWYIVTPKVEVKAYDNVRNDYAYKITYYIDKYFVPYTKSLYIDSASVYPGPSKIYQYMYTGENTEILSYTQDYNLLYFNTAVSISDAGVKPGGDTTPNQPKPATGADATGKLPGTFEIANTLKTYLYSPSDNLRANIQILGDPDFLMTDRAAVIRNAAAPDITINPNAGPVFIEIGFNQVEDYGASGDYPPKYLDNGLLNPNNNIVFWNYPDDIAKKSEGRMIYLLWRVTSRLSGGKFTQDFKVGLPNFARAAQQDAKDNGRKDTEVQKQTANAGNPTRLTPQQMERQQTNVQGLSQSAATRIRQIDNRIVPNTNIEDNIPNRRSATEVDTGDDGS